MRWSNRCCGLRRSPQLTMHPYFSLFGKEIPAYWLCVLAGAAASAVLLLLRHKRFPELQQVDITNGAALAVVGVIIGGRALYLLTILPVIIRRWSYIVENHLFEELLSNGMVFYGGLFGAITALFVYLRKYRIDGDSFSDYIVPVFPLFHAFGRVGCFLTGCCHGIVSDRYGIAFSHSISSENGIPYFPVQLLGSVLEFLLFLVLILYERKHHKHGKSLRFYLFVYATGRFLIEFLRGDTVRGIWFGLSTSQWISLAVILVIIIRSLSFMKRKTAEGAD